MDNKREEIANLVRDLAAKEETTKNIVFPPLNFSGRKERRKRTNGREDDDEDWIPKSTKVEATQKEEDENDGGAFVKVTGQDVEESDVEVLQLTPTRGN